MCFLAEQETTVIFYVEDDTFCLKSLDQKLGVVSYMGMTS